MTAQFSEIMVYGSSFPSGARNRSRVRAPLDLRYTRDIMTKTKPLGSSAEETARLAALYQVSQAIGTSLNLDETLRIAMDSAIRLTRAERGFLMLFEEPGNLAFRLARDAHGEGIEEGQFEVSRTVVQEVARSGTAVVTTDARQDPRFAKHDSVVQFSLRSILAVPLKVRGQIIGVLYVDNKARNALFGQGDLDLLNAFAGQAAVAIENARLYTHADQALAARVSELQTMQTIDRQLNAAALDLDQVLETTLDWALRRTQAERGWIGLYDPSTATVRVGASRGKAAGTGSLAGESLPASKPRLAAALRAGQMQAFAAPMAGTQQTEPAALVAPVLREQHVLALIVVERAEQDFGLEAGGYLARLADHAALAIENAQLYAALKQANDAKSEFVRTVSHELKIPMTSIKGYTDLLKMVGPLTVQQEQFVGTIRSNVERMAVLVSDLSDISRIETNQLKVDVRSLDLHALLPEALSGLRGQIENKEQTLTLDMAANLPAVRSDEARLIQILANLVSNAHKYSPRGAAITLAARPEDGHVRIAVTDTGYGISPADQARLYNQFFRSEDPTIREQTGWGLGLHITRRLIELLGGQISVQSEPGKGSTFSFTMPAVR
jgi:signal transduction histidine kinase